MIITVHQPKSRPNQDVYFTPIKSAVFGPLFTPEMTMKEQSAIAQKFNKGRSIYFN